MTQTTINRTFARQQLSTARAGLHEAPTRDGLGERFVTTYRAAGAAACGLVSLRTSTQAGHITGRLWDLLREIPGAEAWADQFAAARLRLVVHDDRETAPLTNAEVTDLLAAARALCDFAARDIVGYTRGPLDGERGSTYLVCGCGRTTAWPPSKTSIRCGGCGAQWHNSAPDA